MEQGDGCGDPCQVMHHGCHAAAGAADLRRGMQQVPEATPAPASSMSAEAHAGFAHVAHMLEAQGVIDPFGQAHLTSTLVQFFDARMVRSLSSRLLTGSSHRSCLPCTGAGDVFTKR